ncbi:MAG: porin, partial [Rhizobiaceae bacterium]
GARAADAVVAEPEAVEYVRVCDAYGAGFFYIPGTETCLKIGGYVRYQIDFAEGDDGWRKTSKAMLNVTASSDTELGTLTSYIEMTATRTFSGDPFNGFGLDHAWISLGGLKMGYSDTLFDGDINGEFDSFGGAGVNFISYTFSGGNGFSASLSLEEADRNVDYMPNVVGKLAYAAGSFDARAWLAYDATWETFHAKAIVGFKASDMITLQVGGTYNEDPNPDFLNPSIYSNGYEWSLGGSVKAQINEKLALTVGGQYFINDIRDNLLIADVYQGDDWAIGAVVDYTVVPGFTTKLAVNYRDGDSYVDGSFDGFLRFERSF